MHQLPVFSIALPVFNGEPYIQLCIESILKQTYPHFKLLIFNSVNNTDGSSEYIKNITDSRVKIIQASEVLNIQQNWGRFIHEFDTEFATIIGQDDILFPNFLEKMLGLIQQFPDASLWHSHFTFIDKSGNRIRDCELLPLKESPATYLKNILTSKSDSIGTGYIFRSNDYLKTDGIPLYPSLLFADLALWLKLTELSYKANSQEQLFSFRIHDSTTSLSSATTYFNAFILFIKFLKTFSSQKIEYAEVLKEYLPQYLVFCVELMSFKIIRAKIPVTIHQKKFTVKYMVSVLNEFLEEEKLPSQKGGLNVTFKTKFASFINSSIFLQKTYQFFKALKFK